VAALLLRCRKRARSVKSQFRTGRWQRGKERVTHFELDSFHFVVIEHIQQRRPQGWYRSFQTRLDDGGDVEVFDDLCILRFAEERTEEWVGVVAADLLVLRPDLNRWED
jgi:hypothetical protein